MKKQLYIILLIVTAGVLQVNAQSELAPCGNDNYYSPWLRSYLASGAPAARTGEVLYIPVKIHLVADTDGTGEMGLNTLYKSFCRLNQDFEAAEIQFFIKDGINYINNSAYFNHNYDVGWDMMSANNVANAINCYIVNNAAGACGYFYPGVDGIALAKNCTQPNDHTWAHEIGHFLSLPHTFFGWSSVDDLDFSVPAPEFAGGVAVEYADGSNCQTAADGFCDTPADYLNYRWSCDNDGYSTVTQIDPTGATFTSEGRFFMSYSNDACANQFSGEQINAMRANLQQLRTNLLTTSPGDVVIPLTEEVTVISPEEGSLIDDTGTVRIEWEAIPNAEKYIVQVNPFPIFSIVFNEFIVEDTFVDFDNLKNDDTFYWRVRPYSAYYTCHGFTDAASFNTGSNVVNTFELKEGESLHLFPNPAKDGYLWMNLTSLIATDAHWEITDLSGRVVQKGEKNVMVGEQKILINTQDFTDGMYVLGLQLEDQKVFRKFVITK